MKKILTTSTILTFLSSSCGKVVDTKAPDEYGQQVDDSDIETPDLEKHLGYKKIGVAGYALSTSGDGLEMKNTISDWTYNADTRNYGSSYAHVSGKVQMVSSSQYDSGKHVSAINSFEFKQNVGILRGTLIAMSSVGNSTTATKSIILPTGSNPAEVFNYKFVSKLYMSLLNDTSITIGEILIKTKILARFLGEQVGAITTTVSNTGQGGATLYATDEVSVLFVTGHTNTVINLPGYNPFTTLLTEEKANEYIKESLTSKDFGLADKHLDALFINVKDQLHNTEDKYKAFVEENIFEDTEIVMIGLKSEHQTGSSQKTFAKDNITTSSYSKYASAFMAGYKSAVLQLKWSKTEQEWEETNIAFLIGATSDSESKKKAFAFRRGVEAAAANKDYSSFLKIKFVSKTEDLSKSSKKLYREVSEWNAIDESKTKLYEFTSSDNFADAEKRIIYIAGASAKDWRGSTADTTANQWDVGDNTGLIGALFNYSIVNTNDTADSVLSSKTYSGTTSIVLDAIGTGKDSIIGDNTTVERRGIKVLGSLGDSKSGTSVITEALLRQLFLTDKKKDQTRLHKHTIYGGDFQMRERLSWTDVKTRSWNKRVTFDATTNAINDANLTEDELTQTSPWMK